LIILLYVSIFLYYEDSSRHEPEKGEVCHGMKCGICTAYGRIKKRRNA
jgi:hypothetical protein